jgi:hypothetical protein
MHALSGIRTRDPINQAAADLRLTPTLGKTSIAVHQWTAKQFWVDHQSFKQEDNIYCLENFQINQLNVYLQFKLLYDICYTYE